MGQHGSACCQQAPDTAACLPHFFALADAMLTAHWQERGAKIATPRSAVSTGAGATAKSDALALAPLDEAWKGLCWKTL